MAQKTSYLSEEIQQQIETIAERIAEEKAESAPLDPLHTKEQIKQTYKTEVNKQIADFFEHFVQGSIQLIATLQTLSKEDPKYFSEEIEAHLDKISDAIALTVNNPEEKRTPRMIANIPDESMKIFHQAALTLYKNKDYPNASAVYNFLTFLDQNEPLFWMGLGHSEYFNQRFDKALEAYHAVAERQPHNPHSYFYSAHCHHALNQTDKALENATKALEIIKNNPELKEWLEQAEALKSHFAELLKKP